jgi:hypothetical protein
MFACVLPEGLAKVGENVGDLLAVEVRGGHVAVPIDRTTINSRSVCPGTWPVMSAPWGVPVPSSPWQFAQFAAYQTPPHSRSPESSEGTACTPVASHQAPVSPVG